MSDELTSQLRTRRAEAIRAARVARGLKQRQVVEALAADHNITVTVQSVSKWEAGAVPALGVQAALASVLGVNWSDLFGLDGAVAR